MNHEFAVDAMENGLQVVSFPRVLAVKELQHPHLRDRQHFKLF